MRLERMLKVDHRHLTTHRGVGSSGLEAEPEADFWPERARRASKTSASSAAALLPREIFSMRDHASVARASIAYDPLASASSSNAACNCCCSVAFVSLKTFPRA